MKTKFHYALLLVSFLASLVIMYNRINTPSRVVLWSDSEGYYKYLPGLFILQDFHKMDAGSVWPNLNDKGEYVIKYTCAVAYFELPFFGIAYFLNQLKKGN